jgi:1,4-alpha-glucan branching enzyme
MLTVKTAKSGNYKVTFILPAEEVEGKVSVVGDFNEWVPGASELKKRSNGTVSVTLELEPGTYRFRYLASGARWLNEPEAHGFTGMDSTLQLP